MDNNQLVNVIKTLKKTELVFEDDNCKLRVGKSDVKVEDQDGEELISIYPEIREREYRVLYSSSTLDKHGTSNAQELIDYWEANNFFFDLSGVGTGSGISFDYRAVDYNDLITNVAPNPTDGEIAFTERSYTTGTPWWDFVNATATIYLSGFYIAENGVWISDKEKIAEQLQINIDDIEAIEAENLAQNTAISNNSSNISQNASAIIVEASTRANADLLLSDRIDNIPPPPVDSVFGRVGAIVSQNDDYTSSQVQVTTLDSSYLDLDFTGYGTLRTGEYQIQSIGSFISNAPFVLNSAATYNLRVQVNNNSWNSVEIDFSNNGDINNNNRKFYRTGQDLITAISLGWNERVLQPQEESLTSLEVLNSGLRAGQTTEGLINNTTTLEIYIPQAFTPRRSGKFKCDAFALTSLNDGAQDFICDFAIYENGVRVGGLQEPIRVEPKDTASTGPNLNTLSGGVITGTANTSTNQRFTLTPWFYVLLTEGVLYELRLEWAGSAVDDLAAIYSGTTSIKESLT